MQRFAPRMVLGIATATILVSMAAGASAQANSATWSSVSSAGAWSPSGVAAPACAGCQPCVMSAASMTAGAYPTYAFPASSAPIYAPAVSCNLPAACPAPNVSAIVPLPGASYVAGYPVPYAAYRAPYSAVVGGRTVIVRPKVYVPGQPVRNFWRAVLP